MKPLILLVDDDEVVREVVAYQLQRAGYRVLAAENGGEALEIFTRDRPDVIITDVNMPKVDGIQLLKRIKEIAKEARIILITANGAVKSAVEAMKMGACDYIEKPFSAEVLKKSVEEAIDCRNETI